MQTILARNAMATRFEIVLTGDDAVRLRAAGEEALDEIERLEAQLSLYRSTSELSSINAHAASRPIKVEPQLFQLLQLARRLHHETDGAFDITIAPLMRCWGFITGSGAKPDPNAIQEAREKVGMHLVELDEEKFTIHFRRPGVMLDLGAIGKGYAMDRAVQILRDLEISSALLHGGTSTVSAIGNPPESDAWKVAIQIPANDAARIPFPLQKLHPEQAGSPAILTTVNLKDEAMSVSGVHGKGFTSDETYYGHVIDPRTGWPVQGTLLSAVLLHSGTEADALSTALLTSGHAGWEKLTENRTSMRSLIVSEDQTKICRVHSHGIPEFTPLAS